MKQLGAIASWLPFLVAAPAVAPNIEITPNGSRPSTRGPAQNFTGSVVIDPLFSATDHTRATGAKVTFEPGARTHGMPIRPARF